MISIEKIKEYTKCPQFGDLNYGEWGTLRLEQRQAYRDLIDIIEGMEQEIERLIISLQAQEEETMNEHIKVERLNNIINELEKYLLELRLTDVDGKTIVYRLLDKLQELKGSDKE